MFDFCACLRGRKDELSSLRWKKTSFHAVPIGTCLNGRRRQDTVPRCQWSVRDQWSEGQYSSQQTWTHLDPASIPFFTLKKQCHKIFKLCFLFIKQIFLVSIKGTVPQEDSWIPLTNKMLFEKKKQGGGNSRDTVSLRLNHFMKAKEKEKDKSPWRWGPRAGAESPGSWILCPACSSCGPPLPGWSRAPDELTCFSWNFVYTVADRH